MSHLSEYIRGVVFHDGAILFLENLCAYQPQIGIEPRMPGLFPLVIPRASMWSPLPAEEFKRLRDQCMRDTLVYETECKGTQAGIHMRIHTEHDYPLTPERLVGRIE